MMPPAVRDYRNVLVDVTGRCDLRCPVCYQNSPVPVDVPLRELEQIARRLSNTVVSLAGGEPTLREDLPDIIRLFNRNNTVFLVTNGLSLAAPGYAQSLRASGLRYVSFSFNGLSDDVYTAIHGRPLLATKLAALAAVRDAGMKVILSVMIVPGVNEAHLGPLAAFCREWRDVIEEMKVRAMAPFGRHLPGQHYSADDLLKLVCRELGVRAEDVAREQALKGKVNEALGRPVFPLRECSYDLLLRYAAGGMEAAGSRVHERVLAPGRQGPVSLARALLKMYGGAMVAAGMLKYARRDPRPWIHGRSLFKIGIRSWPSRPCAGDRCRTGYASAAGIMPFCEAVASGASIVRRSA